jgi:hypothetical protein
LLTDGRSSLLIPPGCGRPLLHLRRRSVATRCLPSPAARLQLQLQPRAPAASATQPAGSPAPPRALLAPFALTHLPPPPFACAARCVLRARAHACTVPAVRGSYLVLSRVVHADMYHLITEGNVEDEGAKNCAIS